MRVKERERVSACLWRKIESKLKRAKPFHTQKRSKRKEIKGKERRRL